ncbi:hypothetical protein HNP37_003146 [Flavobacterium nitrogenifigens]|uniref:Uncharacterized protein n=2 Tax=Flavobacterium TaxID=237 RepID=A0A7W7N938_9FLAO|nr:MULTISPECIES: hypothetical protein [Flavobacterium]MBB4803071.1 hypothetical protein [Flavobacterium nitrogenifigens]MBB6388029.1 hypothetical protein [Flavobacterium notoginsengisoli]
MAEIITIKNKPNWFLAIFLPFGLLILILIMFVFLPIASAQNTYLFSILRYITLLIPFLGFFIVFLKIWLWNTFGKVILEISSEKIKVTNKNCLFNKPKEYQVSEIEKLSILDLGIERTKFNVRLNYLFSKSNYSVIIVKGSKSIRIIDWLDIEQAKSILEKTNKIMNEKGKIESK